MAKTRLFDPVGAAFGIALPLLAGASILILTRQWEPRLPEQIATHWSGTTADGFGSPMSAAWTVALIVVLVGGGCSAIAALAQAQLMMRRFMLATGLGVTGLIVGVWFGALAAQLGIDDPATAPLPTWPMVAGLWAGVLLGWLSGKFLRDGRERKVATAAPDPALPRGRTELPVVDPVGTGTGTTVALTLLVLVPILIVCAATQSWWPLGMAVPLLVPMLGLLRFTVVVDDHGLRVTNLATTVVEYGIDELVGAQVTETRPFQDWGGWGLRTKGRNRYGLVTVSGPALVFRTASGHEFTVTTARAEEMAGALNSLADARTTG